MNGLLKKTKGYVQKNKILWKTMILLEYKEIRIILSYMTIPFWFVKVSIWYWRGSKQSRSRKITPASQYATNFLWKEHCIDLGGYALKGTVLHFFLG